MDHELESSERESTGISNLKVKYNGAFGYFIEVTKANLHLVPEHYIRKQRLMPSVSTQMNLGRKRKRF